MTPFTQTANLMSSAVILRGMKRKSPLLQSAAAAIAFACSSQGAFVSNSRFPTPTLAMKPVSSNNFISPIQKVNYSTANKITLAMDTNDNTGVEALPSSTTCTDDLLLAYEDGSHRSAKIIISENESSSIDSFKHRLESTIMGCKELNKSSLWVSVPMSKARYIEAMSDIDGLDFHHASGKTAHVAMWLKEDIECKIPEFATHQVGVGAIVVNSKDEILCVRELRNNYRPWKIPGGLADLGEQLDAAAIREVMEETGIECRFKSVLGFRHTHGLQFGRSDLYFVCRLEPVERSDEDGNVVIPEPVAQVEEIAAASWVPLQEYKDMVNEGENPHPLMQKMMSLHDLEENDIQRTVVNSIVPGRKPSPIYHPSTPN